ncbi:hypothetical protein [Streptomyces sp. NPDC037389]|uniref:hypothetical protein n=1 Tax=Streptomyces sp. NPDC037389 TaxID=3155369 RepID=UPI0033E48AA1
MTLDDPFADVSPWDEPSSRTTITEEQPLTTTPTTESAPAGRAPFQIGSTLKASSAFDGEWLTPRASGDTATEAARRMAELLDAIKQERVMEKHAAAAEFMRQQHRGGQGQAVAPKRFENGKVVPAAPSADTTGYSCTHGPRTFKDGGSWAAYFCGGRGLDKPQQCPPLWRQKDGTFRAN